MAEADTPPQPNTVRYYLWQTVQGLQYLRAYWGRRLVGGALGLMGDALAEGASQAVYARMPGHPQQSTDSLAQTAKDRGLTPFRGETRLNLIARVQAAWSDYTQAGTWQKVIRAVNEWGNAGWPGSWVDLDQSNLVESSTDFSFVVTIPYGNINPPWTPWLVGDGSIIGEPGLFIGVGPSTDIPMMLWVVKKWKPSRSIGYVQVFYEPSASVTFNVG